MMGRISTTMSRCIHFPSFIFLNSLWSGKDKNKILTREEGLKLAGLLLNISAEGYFAKKHPEKYAVRSE
jgi:hypothetical protein